MSERVYLHVSLPAFKFELKKKKTANMVNYKTVYFNAKLCSFPLGMILGYNYS